ncbi:hypothetical protein LCGC14_2371100 [marine sediment metagenome]|uniref:Uncharacterized protein n=1 Tax=marine sediment metagenome TaxID=412755 RepID=A0A0F9C3R4_9ZZZZ
MKVYIDWGKWRDFPFLSTKKESEGETSNEIPDELYKRWNDAVEEMERIVEELDILWREQRNESQTA